MRGSRFIFKGTAILAVLFYFLLAGYPAHAQTGQVVIVNNVALKAAEGINIQLYRLQGKSQKLLKNEMVVASEDCANGCGSAPIAIDVTPGDYKVQVFGGVVLDADAVTFPLKTADQFVFMVSNAKNAPSLSAHAPGLKLVEEKSPFRIDLITYTKGASLNITPVQPPAARPAKKGFWPFKPDNGPRSVNE